MATPVPRGCLIGLLVAIVAGLEICSSGLVAVTSLAIRIPVVLHGGITKTHNPWVATFWIPDGNGKFLVGPWRSLGLVVSLEALARNLNPPGSPAGRFRSLIHGQGLTVSVPAFEVTLGATPLVPTITRYL